MVASENQNQLIYNPGPCDLDTFESLGLQARDAGFTHLLISELTEPSDYRGDDEDSPWCVWSSRNASVFKFVTPPGLEGNFGEGFVERQMAAMKARHDIAEKLGLKAAWHGVEPHWLSERVYEKLPHWRGARCENSLRSTGLFFAPNIDHPEVQDAYRFAVREMLKQCPLLETLSFLANDSGSGVPYAQRLYVNVNGPTDTIGIGMGDRVTKFMKVLREGAAEAGCDMNVYCTVHDRFVPFEAEAIIAKMEPGIGLFGRNPREDLVADGSLMRLGTWGDLSDCFFKDFPNPFAVVGAATQIKSSPARRFVVNGGSRDLFAAFKTAMAAPNPNGERERLDVAAKVIASVYAEDVADEILDASCIMERARVLERAVPKAYLVGPLMLRWLTRPLVPHQELLTEDERAYWEPYIYQSFRSQPHSYLDYLNVTGQPIASTWDHATLLCCTVDGIESLWRSSAACLEQARDKTADDTARQKIQNDIYRIRARRSAILTYRHFLQMGTLIYERDKARPEGFNKEAIGEVTNETPAMPLGSSGSNALWYMYRSMRWELDNVNELIGIMEESPVPVFELKSDRTHADALRLEPELLENLRRKAKIMLKYWRSAERGYYLPTKGG